MKKGQSSLLQPPKETLLGSFPESRGSRAQMDDHRETEPGLLTSKVQKSRESGFFDGKMNYE